LDWLTIKGEKYEVVSDLHTHTRYSHGKGSIEDNVKVAVAKGLKTIGISDHGPGHIGFGVPRKKLALMKEEIIRLRQVYPEIEILFGIEANILLPEKCLDVKREEYEYFDYICAGWHFGAIDRLTPEWISGAFSNFLRSTYKSATKRQIIRNTEAFAAVVRAGGIKFLTHPGQSAPIDLIEIAAVCGKEGTLLEISTNHMTLTPKVLEEMTREGARFIISSDAHRPERVGDFHLAEKLLNEADIDPACVENLVKV